MKDQFKPVVLDSVDVVQKTFDFSLNLIELYIFLVKTNEFDFAERLLKAGTNIRQNIEQSIVADSKSEFYHKLSLASKDAMEVRYWLKEIQMKHIMHDCCDSCVEKINEIIKIILYMTQATFATEVQFNLGNLN